MIEKYYELGDPMDSGVHIYRSAVIFWLQDSDIRNPIIDKVYSTVGVDVVLATPFTLIIALHQAILHNDGDRAFLEAIYNIIKDIDITVYWHRTNNMIDKWQDAVRYNPYIPVGRQDFSQYKQNKDGTYTRCVRFNKM